MLEIHKSARKHGIGDGDIRHPFRNALFEVALEPTERERHLMVGPKSSGDLVELVVMGRERGPIVIRAMAVCRSTLDLLRGKRLI